MEYGPKNISEEMSDKVRAFIVDKAVGRRISSEATRFFVEIADRQAFRLFPVVNDINSLELQSSKPPKLYMAGIGFVFGFDAYLVDSVRISHEAAWRKRLEFKFDIVRSVLIESLQDLPDDARERIIDAANQMFPIVREKK